MKRITGAFCARIVYVLLLLLDVFGQLQRTLSVPCCRALSVMFINHCTYYTDFGQINVCIMPMFVCMYSQYDWRI